MAGCSGSDSKTSAPQTTAPAAAPTTTGATTTTVAPLTTAKEVASITATKQLLDALGTSLKANDVNASKLAFNEHDAAWHGVEVYVNVRSLTLYLSIEADIQASIKAGLDKTPVAWNDLIAANDQLKKRFDDAIALSTGGQPMSPLFDDLATVRTARADLAQVITPALTANDVTTAKNAWTRFKGRFSAMNDLIRFRSAATADDVAAAYSAADAKFASATATAAELNPLVSTLNSKIGVGVNLLNAAARNADLSRKSLTDTDLAEVYAFRDMEVQLRKSLAAWQKADYTTAKSAVAVAQNQAYNRVGPALALHAADTALSNALKAYADLAGAAGDESKVTAANKSALDAVGVAQQVLIGQFWGDPKLQATLKALPAA